MNKLTCVIGATPALIISVTAKQHPRAPAKETVIGSTVKRMRYTCGTAWVRLHTARPVVGGDVKVKCRRCDGDVYKALKNTI